MVSQFNLKLDTWQGIAEINPPIYFLKKHFFSLTSLQFLGFLGEGFFLGSPIYTG
jgi:hypothetical protein